MHRIDTPTAQVDKFGAGKNGFTRGNPQTGVPVTALDDDYFDAVQEEIAGVVESTGVVLDKSNRTQLLTALKKLFLRTGNNFSEIAAAGSAAVAAALANLGLSDVAHLPQLTGVIGTSRNARMSVTTGSVTATFTASELIVQEGLGGRQYKLINFNKTINLSVTGMGGMDVGAAPVSGYVALYAIYNPSTQISALLAVNTTSAVATEVYSGANMPAGYTASALVSVWGTIASGFKVGFQSNRHISIPTVGIYSVSAGTTTQTQLSVAPAAPPNAISVDMSITVGETLAGTGVALSLSSSSSGIGQFGASAIVSGSTSSSGETGTLPLIESQRLYFSMSNTNAGSYSISCRGYDF